MVRDGGPRVTSVMSAQNEGDVFNINKNPDEYVSKEETQGLEFLVDSKTPSEHSDDSDDSDDPDEETEENVFGVNPNSYSSNELQLEPEKSYEDIQQEKAFYLSQLNRLIKKGNATSRRFGMEHSLEQIRGEVFRIKKEISIDSGIDYCRQGLMFCISTIEMVEGKYSGKMAGWSQNVMGNIESYDEVFEELYQKYFSESKMGPEFKLISLLAGSAFMFHLNKSMVHGDGSSPPSRQREMDGPSLDTDDLLRRLNEEVDMDDISSVGDSSVASEEPMIKEPEVKTIPVKKPRGRPKKNPN